MRAMAVSETLFMWSNTSPAWLLSWWMANSFLQLHLQQPSSEPLRSYRGRVHGCSLGHGKVQVLPSGRVFSHGKLWSGQVLFRPKFGAKSGKSEQIVIKTQVNYPNISGIQPWFYVLRFFHKVVFYEKSKIRGIFGAHFPFAPKSEHCPDFRGS